MVQPIEPRRAWVSTLAKKRISMTVWDCFAATAKEFPTQEFLVEDGKRAYTYQEAITVCEAMARALFKMGISYGTRVAVWLPSNSCYVFLSLALSGLGAVKISIHDSLGEHEAAMICEDSRAEFLISERIPATAAQCWKAILSPAQILKMSGEETAGTLDLSKPLSDRKLCDIIYTSGSGGRPKGVMLTDRMLLCSAFANCYNRGFTPSRRVFIPLPLSHVYGYVEGVLSCVLTGGTVLLRDKKFQAEEILSFMTGKHVQDILCVPSQMMSILKHLEGTPVLLPDLFAVYCSAASCPDWIWGQIRRVLRITELTTGYGMSEVAGATVQNDPYDGEEILIHSVGRILRRADMDSPVVEYRVMNSDSGCDSPMGEPGELWCRGLVVTEGYYDRPEINKKAFTPDGWFRTGDCGYFDPEGYLVLCGRVDDMYKINGENVSPKFLEDVMGNCPLVNNAEVIGVPDERHGYVGAAFIQLHEDTSENRAKAEEYCREHLARFQVPKYFVYMAEGDWPRTPHGKDPEVPPAPDGGRKVRHTTITEEVRAWQASSKFTAAPSVLSPPACISLSTN